MEPSARGPRSRPTPLPISRPIPLPTPRWVGIDHVQLAFPPGGDERARRFCVEVLGLTEVPKPQQMAARGGGWFEGGNVRVHTGVDPDFAPARKAHPALTIVGLRTFVRERGLDARWNTEIAGVERCHIDDPFGNRIELIEAGEHS